MMVRKLTKDEKAEKDERQKRRDFNYDNSALGHDPTH
jgi:hypothetical protein